jgi:hypothetical protein
MENDLPSTSNGTTVPPPPARPELPRRRGTKPRTPGTRTPGSAVRTPAPTLGVRTPRGASALSISISARDMRPDSGTPGGDVGVSGVSGDVGGLVAGELGVAPGGGSGVASASAPGGVVPARPDGSAPLADVQPVVNGNGVGSHAP